MAVGIGGDGWRRRRRRRGALDCCFVARKSRGDCRLRGERRRT
jgi:hypothetical protein